MVLLKILHLVTFSIKMTKPNSRVVMLYDFWVLRGQKKGRKEKRLVVTIQTPHIVALLQQRRDISSALGCLISLKPRGIAISKGQCLSAISSCWCWISWTKHTSKIITRASKWQLVSVQCLSSPVCCISLHFESLCVCGFKLFTCQ